MIMPLESLLSQCGKYLIGKFILGKSTGCSTIMILGKIVSPLRGPVSLSYWAIWAEGTKLLSRPWFCQSDTWKYLHLSHSASVKLTENLATRLHPVRTSYCSGISPCLYAICEGSLLNPWSKFFAIASFHASFQFSSCCYFSEFLWGPDPMIAMIFFYCFYPLHVDACRHFLML